MTYLGLMLILVGSYFTIRNLSWIVRYWNDPRRRWR